MAKLKLGVLLSGGGTTLRNLLDLQMAGKMAGEVVCVAADRPSARGLHQPVAAGLGDLPTRVFVPPGEQALRPAWASEILAWCAGYGAELVLLCGFLRLLPFSEEWSGRVLNIHPSLLPAFGGQGFHGHKVHQAVLDMVYDRGPILVQQTVMVAEDDTAETLAKRVFQAECQAYPEAIDLLAAGRVRLEGRRARILPP